jgi:transposase InsO family protein
MPHVVHRTELDPGAEVRRLKVEVRRLTEERDILKNPPRTLPGRKAKYPSCARTSASTMCRVLGLHRSGYYARLRDLASGAVYGYRKITLDLREAGERCSRHRVRWLMKIEGLRAQVGYGSKPRHRGGPVGRMKNVLNRDFTPDTPNKVWVTDITYIRTYEG